MRHESSLPQEKETQFDQLKGSKQVSNHDLFTIDRQDFENQCHFIKLNQTIVRVFRSYLWSDETKRHLPQNGRFHFGHHVC